MEKKICIKCNVEKEINQFQLQKFKKYSRYCSWCKDCNKIYQKEYREKNKNKIKNQRHNFYKENERLKEIENKLIFIKNRVKQGMSQENINKCAIELVNSYLKEN